MTDYVPLAPLVTLDAPPSPEETYWSAFSEELVVRESDAVTHVHFQQSEPGHFCTTSSAQVKLWDGRRTEAEPLKSFTRAFKSTVYCGQMRPDGALMAAGGEEGRVRVFDANSRALLKYFRGHEGSVRALSWISNTQLFSGGHDRTVRLWDMAAAEQTLTVMRGHEDFVRCTGVSPLNPFVLFSGAYDHTVRIWDTREGTCVGTLQHTAPVEALCVLSSGLVAAAGGTDVRVFDVARKSALTTLTNHTKTVTALCAQKDRRRLISAGLDGRVKVYDTDDYTVLHTLNYPSALLAVGASATHIVAGMADGLLSVRQRPAPESPEPVRVSRARGLARSYLARGTDTLPEEDDFRVPSNRSTTRGVEMDRLLRKKQFREALDAAVQEADVRMFATMLSRLMFDPRELRVALSGRDAPSILPVLRILAKHMFDPSYTQLFMAALDELLTLYAPVVHQSAEMMRILSRLQRQVNREVAGKKRCIYLASQVETIISMQN